ncbi:MAG: carboxypeptidase regulatory-like domain-containing protein [Paraprevotella sp.]|nr:carboxypeptidase regulatory-like domain-containing protein [Paraprevotella sp.]
MKKILSIISCIAGLLVLSNCAKDEEITTGTISGLVSDVTNSNTAIAGATVTLSPLGLSKTTGSNGRYEFTDITPGTYTISVSANNYQTDTKSITVYAGQVVTADFQLGATSTPITIEPMTLSFGPSNETLTFTLTNHSNRTLQYSISGYPAYLTVTPSSAQVAAKGKQTITVKVNRGAITSDTSTQLTVNVGNDSYPVYININSQDLTSKMVITPSTLNFGTAYTTLQFSVRNAGTGGDLIWNISTPTEACLSVSPSQGVTAIGNSTPVTVTLDRSKLKDDLTAFINVNTDGGSVPVTVTASKTGNGGDNPNIGTSNNIAVSRGLMAYYTFDDETANDSYENEINGQLYNSPSFVTETPNGRGKAIFLNKLKEQYINIPMCPVNGKTTFSLSCWLKDFESGIIISTINGNYYNGPTLRVSQSGRFIIHTGGYYDDGRFYSGFSTDISSIQSSAWHHVVVTVSGPNEMLYLYIDGILVDNVNYGSGHIEAKGNKMQIGGTAEGRMEYATSMKIDNVRIYGVTLTAQEVQQIYNAEK